MEGTRKKLLVGLITLALVLIANVVLWSVLSSYEYQGIANTDPWTPIPSLTQTATIVTEIPQPTQTSNLNSNPTSTIDPAKNCTHSTAYWSNHPDVWPSKVIIGNYSYTKDEATAIFETNSNDVASALFIQLHTAFLNVVSGAEYNEVNQTIIDASNWLGLHPVGSEFNQTDEQAGLNLGITLFDYNAGKLGPGPCADDVTPVPEQPTASPTTTEAAPTATYRIARTATASEDSNGSHPHAPPKKTSTPVRPTDAPTQPPPTSEPPPTPAPTSIPPKPTPAPTRPPEPTPAPTISS